VRFYTADECEAWLAGRQRQKPDAQPGLLQYEFRYPGEAHRFYYVARWVASNLTYRDPALLWITGWGIWPSTENWHLYYRLRQSCADHRLLEEAPGHLFLGHESEDLASFLQLAMLNGWDGYLLGHADYVSLQFDHHEYIEFYSTQQALLEDIRSALEGEQK
jgi:hypothetical protein